ncbi:MAG: heparinase II/III family protein, partial [Lentisphaerae bacterium]|nr:heparinase II/III family protein [Lentisphaerota bacterium]
LAQLDEMASWSPLQRPGWTCFSNDQPLPPDGKDGSWLSTGTGVRAIALALDLLPADTVDTALRARLDTLLRAEIEQVVDDWNQKRQWFVKWRNPITNQWVLPLEGLIGACLVLGRERYRDAYEFGVRHMREALDAHGADGEFEEGAHYAAYTVTSMLYTAHAMARAGDDCLLGHPFLQRFPTWLVHHLQPGRWLINCFDSFTPTAPRGGHNPAGDNFLQFLSLLAVTTNHPVARWALRHLFDRPSEDLAGLAVRVLLSEGGDAPAVPLYAAYDRARRVNWRSGWEDDATGVWIRGGHPSDQHDHFDRGHVNFILRGRPILIEAGTPAYHNALICSHYSSGLGHNVLQLGTQMPGQPSTPLGEYLCLPGWQKKAVAPLTVQRLDAAGGEVTVDGTACYDGLQRWRRTVRWTINELTVEDDVALADAHTDIVCFRWHLGATQSPRIQGAGARWQATWSEATLTLESSVPLVVIEEPMPDHTLVARTWDDPAPDHLHPCLVVRSAEPVAGLRLTTHVHPA